MWSNALCRVISVARRERVDQLINYRSPKKNSRVSFAPPSPPSLSLCLLIKPIDIFLFSTIVCRNCRQVAAPSGREKRRRRRRRNWNNGLLIWMEHEGDLSDWSMSMYRYLESVVPSVSIRWTSLTLIQLDLIDVILLKFGEKNILKKLN